MRYIQELGLAFGLLLGDLWNITNNLWLWLSKSNIPLIAKMRCNIKITVSLFFEHFEFFLDLIQFLVYQVLICS